MTQPQPYTRSYSFTNSFAANPTQVFPGSALDAELNNVKTTSDQVLQNLTLLQNDDGTVLNGSIGPNQLSASLQVGFLPPVVWQPNTNYTVSPASTVFNANKFYSCLKSNTSSGSFATDLAAGDWVLIADLTSIPVQTAVNVSIVPAGGIVTADVQDAMYGLDGRITSNQSQITGFTSAGITDATTLGKALLTAASTDVANAALNSWSTGDVKLTFKTVADTGWLLMNDGTIGSVSSGASFASALAQSLFTLLWNNVGSTYAPISGGYGATAAADWAANKAMSLTKALGRALGIAGAGSGLTSRVLGQTVGAETATIAQANLPNVNLPATSLTAATTLTSLVQDVVTGASVTNGTTNIGGSGGAAGAVQIAGTAAVLATTISGNVPLGGSGTALSNMQPTTFLNVMIKL